MSIRMSVGKGSAGPYQRQAITNGVDSQVIFAGATDDIVRYYRASDFFVLPTRHDPCSLAVLEALAMGLPVISTKFNGATEIMTGSPSGSVTPAMLTGTSWWSGGQICAGKALA